MPKGRLAMVALLVAVIFVLGLLLGTFVTHWAGSLSTHRVYNTPAILQQVQTLSQLVTVKYVMEKVEIVEDPSPNPLRFLVLWYDNTRVILVAHGIVKAGVDLSTLKPGDLQISEKKITIRLPPSQITDAYLDEQQTQVVEHTTGLLRSFNKDLEQTTRQNALDDIRRAARSNGILRDADDRARAQLMNLFRQLGFEQVQFANP